MWFPITIFVYLLHSVNALNNGLALTPPMGWMTWGRYRCNTNCEQHSECLSEWLILDITREFISGGYADAGYEYIIIDDCWMQKERGQDGKLLPDWARFPSGIKYISNYIHKNGLKFGIYENYGTVTCEKYAGSKGFVKTDVKTFADWEVDYLKLDGCFTPSDELDYGYPLFSKELNKTGRPIVFSCSWPYYQEHIFNIKPNYEQIQKNCNLWRNYHDIQDSWGSIKMIMNYYGKYHKQMTSYAGPGHWNDPDMLMIGNSGLNVGQSKIQMAVWSILAAPLIMSNDLKNVPREMKEILLNREVIAVDQDPLGIQGGMYKNIYGDLKLWIRQVIPVKNKQFSYAIAFVNMNSYVDQTIIVDMRDLDLDNPDGYTVMDLFAIEELKNITKEDKLTIMVKPMDVVFYKFQVM